MQWNITKNTVQIRKELIQIQTKKNTNSHKNCVNAQTKFLLYIKKQFKCTQSHIITPGIFAIDILNQLDNLRESELKSKPGSQKN